MYNFLHQLSYFSVLIPIVVGLFVFIYLDANSKIVLFVLLFASISNLAPVFFEKKEDVWLFYNLYIVADVSLWAIIFLINQRNKTIRLLTGIIWLFTLLISLYYFFKTGISTRFYNELVCLDSLVQVIWVLLYFYSLYKNEDIEHLFNKPMFWFCVGILLYSPSTYFLFAFYNDIRLAVTDKYAYLWRFHDLMNSLLYISLSIGMWVNRKKATS